MRLSTKSGLFICCCLVASVFAQASNQQSNPKSGDYGVVGDNGEEPDQPVNPASANLSPADTMESAWQMLETGTKDSKEQTRIDALSAIGTLTGIKRAENDLQEAMKDQNIDVRVAAVAATANMQDANLIPTLRLSLDDPAPEVVFAAAVALWKLHDPSGINVLYDVLAGERKTKGSLLQTGQRQVNKDLHDPATLAKIGAQQAAYALFGPFGIGLDAARLMVKSSSTNSARVLTVNLLAQDHSDATRGEFIAALGDRDYFVRAGSARALGDYHGKEVTEALAGVLDDRKPSVRFMAAASYIRSSQPAPPQKKAPRAHANTKQAGEALK